MEHAKSTSPSPKTHSASGGKRAHTHTMKRLPEFFMFGESQRAANGKEWSGERRDAISASSSRVKRFERHNCRFSSDFAAFRGGGDGGSMKAAFGSAKKAELRRPAFCFSRKPLIKARRRRWRRQCDRYGRRSLASPSGRRLLPSARGQRNRPARAYGVRAWEVGVPLAILGGG